MNLGMSRNFGFVDLEHLTFPATLRVDYIRVYQDPDNVNIGCDPPDFPTKAYIDQYVDVYNYSAWTCELTTIYSGTLKHIRTHCLRRGSMTTTRPSRGTNLSKGAATPEIGLSCRYPRYHLLCAVVLLEREFPLDGFPAAGCSCVHCRIVFSLYNICYLLVRACGRLSVWNM